MQGSDCYQVQDYSGPPCMVSNLYGQLKKKKKKKGIQVSYKTGPMFYI